MYFEIMKNYISSLSKDRDTSISSEYLDISSIIYWKYNT